jgi:3-hydroxyacyl-CoA dehydrogenase
MDFSGIRKIGIIGSGIMGHGIGQTFALAGERFFSYPPEKVEEKIKERDRRFLRRLKCLYSR